MKIWETLTILMLAIVISVTTMIAIRYLSPCFSSASWPTYTRDCLIFVVSGG